jgi:LmbE family N-acetylglucosaminyl deacetylase
MTGEPPAGSLAAAPHADVCDAVRQQVAQFQPDVVLTLDGSDGHRDHVAVRDAVRDAAAEVEWVYLHCLPRSLMRAWIAHSLREAPDRAHLEQELSELGTPDELVTTVLDTRRHLGLRWQAIRAHRTQTSPFEGLPPELQEAFLATDHLQRVRPAWQGDGVERVLGPLSGQVLQTG